MKNGNTQMRNDVKQNKSLVSTISSNNSSFSSKNTQPDVSEKYAKVYQMHFKVLADWDLVSGKIGHLDSSHQKNLLHLHEDFDESLTALEKTLKKKDNIVYIKQSSSMREFEKLTKEHNVIGEKFDKEIMQDLSMLKSKTLKSDITPTSTTSTKTKQSKSVSSKSVTSKNPKLASTKMSSSKTKKTKTNNKAKSKNK